MMRVHPAVVWLSLSQLVCWGVAYYPIGIFGELIAADLGWSLSLVYGGFSLSLLTMAICSPIAGWLIDRYGGRYVMAAGSLLIAFGCAGLARVHTVATYFAVWSCLGVAMRLTLYDAAFAALVRIEGPHARRSISQVTLMGGLAATVFWPVGRLLANEFGWRGAMLVFTVCALATVPLHLAIPTNRYEGIDQLVATESAPAEPQRPSFASVFLFGVIVALVNFLNAGLSAHLLNILVGLGIATSIAVWIAALRGIGQSGARLAEVLHGAAIHPLRLHRGAALLLPVCFAIGFAGGRALIAAAALTFLYGVSNGLLTITRGTVPTVLFDHRVYGTATGKVLAPSFILSATGPVVYAQVIHIAGATGALVLSLIVALIVLAASVALEVKHGA